jgi:hypothetical protein
MPSYVILLTKECDTPANWFPSLRDSVRIETIEDNPASISNHYINASLVIKITGGSISCTERAGEKEASDILQQVCDQDDDSDVSDAAFFLVA